jgi:hypothetical protein
MNKKAKFGNKVPYKAPTPVPLLFVAEMNCSDISLDKFFTKNQYLTHISIFL